MHTENARHEQHIQLVSERAVFNITVNTVYIISEMNFQWITSAGTDNQNQPEHK